MERSGVGSELRKLIPRWAYGTGCRCKKKADEYDDAGVDWCKENSEQIVKHLVSQTEHLIPRFV